VSKLVERLSRFISISEDKFVDTSKYGRIISILSVNDSFPMIPKLQSILTESLGTPEFSVVYNSIVDHLESMYVIDEFSIHRRTVSQKKRKNPTASRIAKMRWKKNKSAMLRGLRRFHKSSEGKSFHKALGKFVSKTSSKNEGVEDLQSALLELNELRITLSSAVTQLFIDMKLFPEGYADFSADDFSILMDGYSSVMKDLQDAWNSDDIDFIEDTISEVISEFGSIFIGVDIDFIYDPEVDSLVEIS